MEVFPAWIPSSDNELSRKSQQGRERGRVRRSQLGGFAMRGCSKGLGVSVDRLGKRGAKGGPFRPRGHLVAIIHEQTQQS